jgi:DedD protein
MRTLFDIEEEEEVQSKASEITLSTASLLGIFFGLVLICGVFFGFGYSLGRGAGWVSQAKAADNPPVVKEEPSTASLTPTQEPIPAPVATKQPAKVQQPASKPSTATTPATVAAPVNQESAEVSQPSLVVNRKPAPGKEAGAVETQPAYQPQMDTPPTDGGKPVVQIAAVTRPQDAYALVSVLKQHGYEATIRSDAQDKLLHVQMGPFADRAQASAMKQKLLADGYNAIIKQ